MGLLVDKRHWKWLQRSLKVLTVSVVWVSGRGNKNLMGSEVGTGQLDVIAVQEINKISLNYKGVRAV